MQTFYMMGKFSTGAVRHISAVCTDECTHLVEKLGGEIILTDALLGEYDIALIIRFESNRDALKASLALEKLTGITFKTYPAIPVSEFDKLVKEI